jgi:NAD(P)H-hydrate epimerase
MLPGSEHAGKTQVIDIGIPPTAGAGLAVDLLSAAWVRDRLPARPVSANKGAFGRVLAVAGSANYPGAARLSAEASYRVGAGLVTLACPDAVRSCVAPATPEITYLPLGESLALHPERLAAILGALANCDTLLIGPGLSQLEGVAQTVRDILTAVPANLSASVADADALNALANWDGWHEQVTSALVLTPHPGEMSRLTGRAVAEIQDDRLAVALDAAARWNQVVVLKGAHTIVAAPDGRAAISPHANALLATAGTGDVLAGAIAGLIAQSMDPFEAAACAVYLHGSAAEEAAESIGDRGLLASDLLPALPRAIRTAREGKPLRSAPSFPASVPGLGSLAGLLDPQ